MSFLGEIDDLSTWIAGEGKCFVNLDDWRRDFNAGLFRMGLGADGVSCVSYDKSAGLEKIRRLTSSPPVVDVHTKTRSRST